MIRFSNLQISKKNIPKNYPELEIYISRQKHFTVIVKKFKIRAQDSFLEIKLSEKKPPLIKFENKTRVCM